MADPALVVFGVLYLVLAASLVAMVVLVFQYFGFWRAFAALMATAALAWLMFGASQAKADCRHFFVKKQAVVVQQVAVPVAVYPPVYYSAGGDIQAEALAEKVARLVEGKLALRQQQTLPVPATMLAQKCAKCHSGAQPKGGIAFDGSPLACHQITAAIRAVAADKMPKGGPFLTPEQKGQLLEELLSLEQKPPPPVADGELQ